MMFFRIFFIFISITCIYYNNANALNPNKIIDQYVHKTWKIEDGLPQISIQSMVQTKDGYIWLATQEGVVRFDGVSFKVFDSSNTSAIKSNMIWNLYEDDKQNLPKLLQLAGYRTGFVGKSHLIDHHLLHKKKGEDSPLISYDADADPASQEIIKATRENHTYWVKRHKELGFDYANGVYAANLKELYNDSLNVHNVEWKNKAALQFIDEAGDEPFFLYYSETIPHGPAPWIKKKGYCKH